MKTDSEQHPELIDLGEIDGAFSFEMGYSRPNWQIIRQAITQRGLGREDLQSVWTEAARQWVTQLRSDLGGDYTVIVSRRFILLAELDAEKSRYLLAYAERLMDEIHSRLGAAAWNTGLGSHVILLFSEQDDYYEYISYFYPEGTHPASGGCLIHKDYVHIAAWYDSFGIRRTLAHELTHNCVAHLRLPLWLNEGLATMFDRSAAAMTNWVLDAELKERHLAFWNPETIQEFWAGTSFRKPGDSVELSYSLAEIFVVLSSERKGDWGAFLQHAEVADAGQTAAIAILGIDLGDLAAIFLGKGNWRPRRKAITTLREAWK